MFEQSILDAPRAKSWTYSVSTALQVALIGAALIAPLLKIEALPPVKLEACVCRPPRGEVKIVDARPMRSNHSPREGTLVRTARAPAPIFSAPTSIPQAIPLLIDDPGTIGISGNAPGPHSGVPAGPGVPGGWGDGPPQVAAPPRPNPRPPAGTPEPAKPQVVIGGGQVRPPKLIHEVRPPYPQLARQARISGMVKLAAVIATDGSVQALRAVSGHPLLINAALEAVRQWRYQPTLLNGKP